MNRKIELKTYFADRTHVMLPMRPRFYSGRSRNRMPGPHWLVDAADVDRYLTRPTGEIRLPQYVEVAGETVLLTGQFPGSGTVLLQPLYDWGEPCVAKSAKN